MNNLEQKIKDNKAVIDAKFANKITTASKNDNPVTSFFSKSWDKGWSNHGGPALKPEENKS